MNNECSFEFMILNTESLSLCAIIFANFKDDDLLQSELIAIFFDVTHRMESYLSVD